MVSRLVLARLSSASLGGDGGGGGCVGVGVGFVGVGWWRWLTEVLLHQVELVGGSLGSFLAQRTFRHKISKVSYQQNFIHVLLGQVRSGVTIEGIHSWSRVRAVPFSAGFQFSAVPFSARSHFSVVTFRAGSELSVVPFSAGSRFWCDILWCEACFSAICFNAEP